MPLEVTAAISGAEVKSAGQLMDETTTMAFRLDESGECDGMEAAHRAGLLIEALDRRLGQGVGLLVFDLAAVLRATWVAQETVMEDRDDSSTAVAARQAQRLNAHRSRIIRRIDQLLSEDGITVMVKTYDTTEGARR